VDLQLPENPVTFQSAPFFLINLLWRCLDFSMSACGNEKRIELVAEETENDVRIRFRQLAGLNGALLENFPSDREKNLLAVLEATLMTEPSRQEVVLRLSKTLE
jgi:hypothetical protein